MTIRAVVVDIEGTTVPISFVKDTLFPFARRHLPDFVAAHRQDPPVAAALRDAAELAGIRPDDDGALIAALVGWIDEDRKAPPLKAIQGMIWEAGYRSGELTSPVYGDAALALRAWHGAGITLAVYSSGSVPAQKLLFGHSDRGDLTGLFADWFDLATGSKLESGSYRRIAEALGVGPRRILFLSDHAGELDAAVAAGFRAIHVDRPDGRATPPGDHPSVRSLDEIDPAA